MIKSLRFALVAKGSELHVAMYNPAMSLNRFIVIIWSDHVERLKINTVALCSRAIVFDS